MIKEMRRRLLGGKGCPLAGKVGRSPALAESREPLQLGNLRQGPALGPTNQVMAHTADRNGWLCRLIEFAESEKRLPEGREIHRLIEKSMESERKCEVPGSPMLTNSLTKLRKAMLDRAHHDVFRDSDPVRRSA